MPPPTVLLGPCDPPPVLAVDRGTRAPFLVVCDHAGNAVPARLGTLGLSDEVRAAHIAWDLHALPFAQILAERLDATLVAQLYSRLVIDCNRQRHALDSMAKVSDGVPIPGNADLRDSDRTARWAEILTPYQDRVAAECELRKRMPFCIVSVHSCTPRLRNGPPRPWHLGLISGPDTRLRGALHRSVRAAAPQLTIGENVPYVVDMRNDYTLPIHAEQHGIAYVELEFRNDVIADPDVRNGVAGMLADALRVAEAEMRRPPVSAPTTSCDDDQPQAGPS